MSIRGGISDCSFFFGQAGLGRVPDLEKSHSSCALSSHVSAFRDDRGSCLPSGRILGVYSSSMLVVHILQSRPPRSNISLRPDSGLAFVFLLGCMPFESWWSRCGSSRDLRFCLCASYFPPRFASRKSTFFLTVRIQPSAPAPMQLLSDFRVYSPTGSYLSMLRGRWVRGRRKVMKKPVRAIDMRRTATVLDFAEGRLSGVSHVNWEI